jgi:hypothetical protein
MDAFRYSSTTYTRMMAYEIPHVMFQDETLVHYRSLGEKEGGLYPKVPWSDIAIHGIPLDTTLQLETLSDDIEAIMRQSLQGAEENSSSDESEEIRGPEPIRISSSTKGYGRGHKPSHIKGSFYGTRVRGLKRGSKKYPTKPRINDHRRAR